MGTFFRGWRRKVGTAFLVAALLLTVGWLRSLGRQELIHVCPNRSVLCINSMDGDLGLTRISFLSHDVAVSKSLVLFKSPLKRINVGWSSEKLTNGKEVAPWIGADSEWHWKWGGFSLGTASHGTLMDDRELAYLIVPYWCMVWPMTLLSAFLLLKPTRPPPAKLLPSEAAASGSG